MGCLWVQWILRQSLLPSWWVENGLCSQWGQLPWVVDVPWELWLLFAHHGELDEERWLGEQLRGTWSPCMEWSWSFPSPDVCVHPRAEQCLCLGGLVVALSPEKAHGEVLEAVGDARLAGQSLSAASIQPCPGGSRQLLRAMAVLRALASSYC